MQKSYQECDVLIIGSGIAGASVGYYLLKNQPDCKAVLLESEATTSFHTTGRSAAFLLPFYGGDKVAPLTKFSKWFYEHPPEGFTNTPLLENRGALHIANSGQIETLANYYKQASSFLSGLEMKTKDEVCAIVPVLNNDYVAGGIFDPGCYDLDVSAIHSGFLQGYQAAGGEVITNAEVFEISKDGGGWLVVSKGGTFRAKKIVNAAGAWGDVVAKMAGVAPLGLMPLRRTIIVCPLACEVDKKWPLVIDIDDNFYFRPEGQGILASPGDETLSEPCDCQPEEIDVAKTAHDMETVTGKIITKIDSRWAGLRTFTPDRVPAVGFDKHHDGFFWCVGQGGFGIQTAAAIGLLSADLILGRQLDSDLSKLGISPDSFSPARF
jgi:D-arginine dehydrogenase